jgi:N-hydroxyarylamine O-acetyltransferase
MSRESPSPGLDLDAYCARVGYAGPRTPDIGTLHTLCELQPASITFEAIDVLLERGVDLAPAAIARKLIGHRRGGYCYEQNLLFKWVLEAFGFQVVGLVGRIRWMAPPGSPPRPGTHMALCVTLGGEDWLADVGFGTGVPTSPLRFAATEPQDTRHGPYRVTPTEEGYLVEVRFDTEWRAMYELSREPQRDIDYELPNWFTSTHPASPFRQRLMVARTTPQARYTLLNNRFTVRRPGAAAEKRTLSRDGLEQVLTDVFALPVQPDWRPVLDRAMASGGPSNGGT